MPHPDQSEDSLHVEALLLNPLILWHDCLYDSKLYITSLLIPFCIPLTPAISTLTPAISTFTPAISTLQDSFRSQLLLVVRSASSYIKNNSFSFLFWLFHISISFASYKILVAGLYSLSDNIEMKVPELIDTESEYSQVESILTVYNDFDSLIIQVDELRQLFSMVSYKVVKLSHSSSQYFK